MARNKYHARKTIVGDIVFDSKSEANRYTDLLILQKAGIITDLKCQPAFVLLEGFKDITGKREQAIRYTADFEYFEDGRRIVEEIKSRATAKARDWSLRKRLFKSRYREIELRVVMS
jgi:hypothetical protein